MDTSHGGSADTTCSRNPVPASDHGNPPAYFALSLHGDTLIHFALWKRLIPREARQCASAYHSSLPSCSRSPCAGIKAGSHKMCAFLTPLLRPTTTMKTAITAITCVLTGASLAGAISSLRPPRNAQPRAPTTNRYIVELEQGQGWQESASLHRRMYQFLEDQDILFTVDREFDHEELFVGVAVTLLASSFSLSARVSKSLKFMFRPPGIWRNSLICPESLAFFQIVWYHVLSALLCLPDLIRIRLPNARSSNLHLHLLLQRTLMQ